MEEALVREVPDGDQEEAIEEAFELGGSHAMTRVDDVFYHCSGYSVKAGRRHPIQTMLYLPITGKEVLHLQEEP